jgi:hypothetical protein
MWPFKLKRAVSKLLAVLRSSPVRRIPDSAVPEDEKLTSSCSDPSFWGSLPKNVQEDILVRLGPSYLGVMKHVSSEIRAAARTAEEIAYNGKVGHMTFGDMGVSKDLATWAIDQGCPWTAVDFMRAAAGAKLPTRGFTL